LKPIAVTSQKDGSGKATLAAQAIPAGQTALPLYDET